MTRTRNVLRDNQPNWGCAKREARTGHVQFWRSVTLNSRKRTEDELWPITAARAPSPLRNAAAPGSPTQPDDRKSVFYGVNNSRRLSLAPHHPPPPPTTVPLVTSRFTLKSGATWTLRFRLPSVLAAWPHAMPSPTRRDAAFYARFLRAGTKSSPRRSRLFPSRPLSETQCGSASQMVREARRGPESQSGL